MPTDPATTDPATTDPATTVPATTDPATTDPAARTGTTIDLGGDAVYYETEGSGPPVVLLHGGMATNGTWRAQFAGFSPPGGSSPRNGRPMATPPTGPARSPTRG